MLDEIPMLHASPVSSWYSVSPIEGILNGSGCSPEVTSQMRVGSSKQAFETSRGIIRAWRSLLPLPVVVKEDIQSFRL